MRMTLLAAALALAPPLAHAQGSEVEIRGEIIDTWCYFSGVMGPPESVTGSAHHTCAMWCAAGGIPVGVLTGDGTVYMVMTWPDGAAVGGDAILEMQSDVVTARGMHFERDGINYLMVSQVVDNSGIETVNHDEWGVVPPFAIPEPGE